MTMRRLWMTIGALGALLALDATVIGVAAPRAVAWMESGEGAALTRAGAAAVRSLRSLEPRDAARATAVLVARLAGHRRSMDAAMAAHGRCTGTCMRLKKANVSVDVIVPDAVEAVATPTVIELVDAPEAPPTCSAPAAPAAPEAPAAPSAPAAPATFAAPVTPAAPAICPATPACPRECTGVASDAHTASVWIALTRLRSTI